MTRNTEKRVVEIAWLRRLVDRSVLERMALRHIGELLGYTGGHRSLLVSGAGGGLAVHICRGGGTWETMHDRPEVAELLRAEFGEQAHFMKRNDLPFPDATFDAVVVYGFLEKQAEPATFIAECHRVLKGDGRMVLHVPHAKKWALARGLQRLLGIKSAAGAQRLTAFSPGDLFDVIKDGFDVEDERTYGRFCVDMGEAVADLVALYAARGLRRHHGEEDEDNSDMLQRMYRARTILYPLLLLGRALDLFLFWTRGYYLVCRARRRAWRPRRTPRLQDGRSIADAMINTKIGTAGPF